MKLACSENCESCRDAEGCSACKEGYDLVSYGYCQKHETSVPVGWIIVGVIGLIVIAAAIGCGIYGFIYYRRKKSKKYHEIP